MPKENRIFPDMLLILFKKGYVWYWITFCYVLIALMAALCKDCHTVTHRRSRRGTSSPLVACDSKCRSCSEGNGCIECERRYFLHIYSDPLQPHITQGVCRVDCPEKYYEERSSRENNCRPCNDENCVRCSFENYCTQCSPGFLEYEGACVRNCPLGFSASAERGQCVACDVTNCTTCTEENICAGCALGRYLHENSCFQQCPIGLTADRRTSTCKLQVCDEKCKRCSKKNHCLRCRQGYFLHKNNCHTQCPKGLTPVAKTSRCRARGRKGQPNKGRKRRKKPSKNDTRRKPQKSVHHTNEHFQNNANYAPSSRRRTKRNTIRNDFIKSVLT
ncbi:unnamed protein product [Clavelina lepadiformis]|uniref:R-spondin Fu-CRD domain-containing protein n=1 Tax=Clavelina lepadiformis TaxID=159417 RepID=A0ABP0FWM5_CLALP